MVASLRKSSRGPRLIPCPEGSQLPAPAGQRTASDYVEVIGPRDVQDPVEPPTWPEEPPQQWRLQQGEAAGVRA
jgi:hypothetical protein